MTTKERIIQLIEAKGTTKSIFLKNTGCKRGFLDSDKLTQAVNDKQISAILSGFPDINIEWLVTGKGQMFKPTVILPPDMVTIERYTELVRENERLRIELSTLKK